MVTRVQRAPGGFLTLRQTRRGQAVLQRGPLRGGPTWRSASARTVDPGRGITGLRPHRAGAHATRGRRLRSHWALGWNASRGGQGTSTGIQRERAAGTVPQALVNQPTNQRVTCNVPLPSHPPLPPLQYTGTHTGTYTGTYTGTLHGYTLHGIRWLVGWLTSAWGTVPAARSRWMPVEVA